MTFKILTIDGGGSRGVISLAFLMEIEKRTSKQIGELFDLFVGTSAGSILVSCLNLPDKDNKRKFNSVSDILDFFMHEISNIFYRSWYHRIITLGGLIGPKYESSSEYNVLKKMYDNITLGELLKPTIITSSIIEPTMKYYEFTNAQDKEVKVIDAVMCSSAAPTFFESYRMNYKENSYYFIDGSMGADNPADVGYFEAIKMGIDPDNILLVSIGTGIPTNNKNQNIICENGGILQWAIPVSKNILEVESDIVNYQLCKVLDKENNFYRLNVPITSNKLDITDINELKKMANSVQEYLSANEAYNDYFNEMCKKLL